jgi:hypothetical protein
MRLALKDGERAEDAAGVVTDAESRLKAAQAGVTRAEELLAAAAMRLDLVVSLAGEADARLVGEQSPSGGGGLAVPLMVQRAGVAHDASGQTAGSWHTAAECRG